MSSKDGSIFVATDYNNKGGGWSGRIPLPPMFPLGPFHRSLLKREVNKLAVRLDYLM